MMAARPGLESAPASSAAPVAAAQTEVTMALVADEEAPVEEEPENEADGGKRRKMFKFTARDDLALLTEVITHFPWGAGYGNTRDAWDAVALAVQKRLKEAGAALAEAAPLEHNAVKRRADALLMALRRSEMESLRSTGTAKELAVRNKMLSILSNVMDVHYMHKGKADRRGEATREESMQDAMRDAQQSLRAIDLTGLDEPDAAASPSTPTELTPRRESPHSGPKRKAVLETAAAPPPVKRGRGRPPKIRATGTPAPATTTVTSTAPAPVRRGPGRPPKSRVVVPAPARPVRSASPVTIKTEVPRKETPKELELRERELRVKERRLEIEEQRLAWQVKEADQQTQERLALLEVLRAQSALNQELLAQLRAKSAIA